MPTLRRATVRDGVCHLPRADQLRVQRSAEHLCRLGPRAVAETIVELAEKRADVATALGHLDRMRRISTEMVRVAGGDRFVPNLTPLPGGKRK